MLLNALWAGKCQVLSEAPAGCRDMLHAFGFPLVYVNRTGCQRAAPVVFSSDSDLCLDLTVGDALQHELDCDIPAEALVAVVNLAQLQGIEQGMRLAAEILYASLARNDDPLPLSLYVWAYLSLSASWGWGTDDVSFVTRRNAVLEQVLDFPAHRAGMSFTAYLKLLEPDCLMPRPDAGLGARLQGEATLQAWSARLRADFRNACVRNLASS